jgi:nucleotide-binding universal stress UspA family protein
MADTRESTDVTRSVPTDASYASVLVPLDGSELAERALGPACRLAARLGADVRVVIGDVRRDESWWHQKYLDRLIDRVLVQPIARG